MEERFDCSGMCEPGLFHFGVPLDEGPPNKVCLMYMKRWIDSTLIPFGVTSVICAYLSLLIFIYHIVLYCRPVKDRGQMN